MRPTIEQYKQSVEGILGQLSDLYKEQPENQDTDQAWSIRHRHQQAKEALTWLVNELSEEQE